MTAIVKSAKSVLKNLPVEPVVLKNLTGEPTDDDPILEFASYIEKVNTPAEIEDIVKRLNDANGFNFFKLGGAIAVLQELLKKPKSFREWLKTHGIPYGKAMGAVQAYRKLVQLGIPRSAFENIGWTKVLVLLDVVTKDNVKQWVAIKARVEAEKQKGKPDPEKGPKTTTMTFKPHEDQKEIINAAIEKVKEESGTSDDSVALEYLAQDYLGAGVQFKGWDQALTYARKHSDDPALFYQTIVTRLDELCPELIADTTITLKASAPAE